MSIVRTSKTPVLSARERDCLRLLGTGLSQREVAADLGISRSTLEKHLGAARRKLNVRTTAQAVTLLGKKGELEFPRDALKISNDAASRPGSDREAEWTDRLGLSGGFEEAWVALHRHARMFRVSAINLGIIADPAGSVSEDSCHMISSMPRELVDLHRACGGYSADPLVRYAATNCRPLALTSEELLSAQFSDKPQGGVRVLLDCLQDFQLARFLCVPGRDTGTRAPFAVVFGLPDMRSAEFNWMIAEEGGGLIAIAGMFWKAIQERRLLQDIPGLTRREREAMTLVARGFRVAEISDRLNVSQRVAEKFLSQGRRKLGATTNAQGVYRGLVYRTLG